MRFLTGGDSHGECLTGIIEGLPAGHRLALADIQRDLLRRRKFYGRSPRQRTETDKVRIVSGLWKGKTTGAPLTILIENRGRKPRGRQRLRSIPRPGHADLAGCLKYGLDDVTPIAERASARSTAMRVAIGAIAKSFLKLFSFDVFSHVISIGPVESDPGDRTLESLKARASRSPLMCADCEAARAMAEVIRKAVKEGDSLGGSVEIRAGGVVPGLGSHAEWNRRLDGRLAGALMSIQSVKALEVGAGLEISRAKGSEAHDGIHLQGGRIARLSNFAGGIEGGMTNGEEIVIRLYVKPIPTIPGGLPSIDMNTLEAARAPYVRSDTCVVPAVGVIGEAVTAWVLLEALLEKFGGDHIQETLNNYSAYKSLLEKRGAL